MARRSGSRPLVRCRHRHELRRQQPNRRKSERLPGRLGWPSGAPAIPPLVALAASRIAKPSLPSGASVLER
jgi:hypothetical protein